MSVIALELWIFLTFLNIQIGGFTKAVAVSLLASLSLSSPPCILRAVPSPLPSTLMMLCSSALNAHPRPLARQARGLGCKARVHRLNTDTNGPELREKPLTHAKTPHGVRDAPEAMLVSSDLDDAVRDQRHLSQFQTGLSQSAIPSESALLPSDSDRSWFGVVRNRGVSVTDESFNPPLRFHQGQNAQRTTAAGHAYTEPPLSRISPRPKAERRRPSALISSHYSSTKTPLLHT